MDLHKTTDKVKPKFNVGDWVVNKFGDLWHIDSFDGKYYQVSNGDKHCYFPIEKQNEMRLCSMIEEVKKMFAKLGDKEQVDVMVDFYNYIFSIQQDEFKKRIGVE